MKNQIEKLVAEVKEFDNVLYQEKMANIKIKSQADFLYHAVFCRSPNQCLDVLQKTGFAEVTCELIDEIEAQHPDNVRARIALSLIALGSITGAALEPKEWNEALVDFSATLFGIVDTIEKTGCGFRYSKIGPNGANNWLYTSSGYYHLGYLVRGKSIYFTVWVEGFDEEIQDTRMFFVKV